MELKEHYGRLLVSDNRCGIYRVELKLEPQSVDIWIEHTDDEGLCSECGASRPKYDTREERTWRYINTIQFATHLQFEVPRVRCKNAWR